MLTDPCDFMTSGQHTRILAVSTLLSIILIEFVNLSVSSSTSGIAVIRRLALARNKVRLRSVRT